MRDVYEGIDETDLDRIVLDLPEPWRVVKHATVALRRRRDPRLLPADHRCRWPGSGRNSTAHRSGMAESLEVLQRTWHVEGQSVRPDHRMVAHTGFLTAARLLDPDPGFGVSPESAV